MRKEINTRKEPRLLVKKCHVCGQLAESHNELEKCLSCGKSFLPLNYFEKVHNHEQTEYKNLFAECQELHEDDLIKGLYVIW